MDNRQCKICDKVKSVANYDGKNKRFKSYYTCRDCVSAKLIRCNHCDIAKEHTEYRLDKSSGAYLGRKSRCIECVKETDKDYYNSDHGKARQAKYYKEYYRDNRERCLEYSKERYQKIHGK